MLGQWLFLAGCAVFSVGILITMRPDFQDRKKYYERIIRIVWGLSFVIFMVSTYASLKRL